jgi:hypothetical protein
MRIDRERSFVIGDGFIEPTRAIEEKATVIIGQVIVARYCQGMIEKGEGIFPNAELTPSPQHTRRQHRHRDENENWSGQLRENRKERELQTKDRQIGVTIGHVMQTDVHKSEHGKQHDHKPEPPNR